MWQTACVTSNCHLNATMNNFNQISTALIVDMTAGVTCVCSNIVSTQFGFVFQAIEPLK